jgi:hypothetical protein
MATAHLLITPPCYILTAVTSSNHLLPCKNITLRQQRVGEGVVTQSHISFLSGARPANFLPDSPAMIDGFISTVDIEHRGVLLDI